MHSILLISIVYFTGCWAREDVKGPWVHITTYLKGLLQRRQNILLSIDSNGKGNLQSQVPVPQATQPATKRYTCKHNAMTLSWVCLYTSILLALLGSRKWARCGSGNGCQQSEDCGACLNCLDKTKFGGPGRKKQCCTKMKCTFIIRSHISLPFTCT